MGSLDAVLVLLVACALGLQDSTGSTPFPRERLGPDPPHPEALEPSDLWGSYGHSLFGSVVARAGDVDLDRRPDLLVANPGLYGDVGMVWVLSGRDAKTLHRVESAERGDGFGHDIAAAGDVDADGHPDWIVGSWVEKSDGSQPLYPSDLRGPRLEFFQGSVRREAGYASVFSGRTGERLLYLRGEKRGDLFGYAVDGAGDIDGDGHADLVVGSPRADRGSGHVDVFSGKDGSRLRRLEAERAGELLGIAVCGCGDLDSDGRPDVIAALGGDGGARAYSSRTGKVLWTAGIPAGDAGEGVQVRRSGDMDQDGLEDVLLGRSDVVVVISGRSGSTRRIFEAWPDKESGGAADRLDDLDGDGKVDFVVGLPRAHIGIGGVLVLSTKTGGALARIEGPDDLWGLGSSIATLGDIDDDGHSDFAVGVDNSESHYPGRARVYSGWTRKLLLEIGRFGNEVRRIP